MLQKGGLVGLIGGGEEVTSTITVKNSYAITKNNDPVVSNYNDAKYSKYENVYGTKGGNIKAVGITVLAKGQMTGEAAKNYMKGLAFLTTGIMKLPKSRPLCRP